MKNPLKTFGIIAILAVIVFSVTGCASIKFAPFMNLTGDYVDSSVSISKRGEAVSRVWVGIFGKEFFPTVERVAKENGITKVATVEHTVKPGILAIWVDYYTIVSGQ